jgi:hypothetical protein
MEGTPVLFQENAWGYPNFHWSQFPFKTNHCWHDSFDLEVRVRDRGTGIHHKMVPVTTIDEFFGFFRSWETGIGFAHLNAMRA